MTQHHERPRAISRADPVDRVVGDQIGHIATAFHHPPVSFEHHRIVIVALAGQDSPVVETGRIVARAVTQMPLTDHGCLVSRIAQQPREGDQGVVHVGIERRHPIHMVVGAGENRCPRRRTDRIGAKSSVESHTTICDAVDVRRGVDP